MADKRHYLDELREAAATITALTDAFRRGAEDMRERAARVCDGTVESARSNARYAFEKDKNAQLGDRFELLASYFAKSATAIRSLPIPDGDGWQSMESAPKDGRLVEQR